MYFRRTKVTRDRKIQHITQCDQSEDNQSPCALAVIKKTQIKGEERY